MSGGQDWANEERQIESTGEKLTIEERTRRAIAFYETRIASDTMMLMRLKGECDNDDIGPA